MNLKTLADTAKQLPAKIGTKALAVSVGGIILACIVLVVIGRQIGYNQNIDAQVLSAQIAQNQEYSAKKSELDAVIAQLEQKQSVLDELNTYTANKEKLAQELSDAQAKVDSLNAQIETLNSSIQSKQSELDTLTANVTKAVGAPKTLPAGNFTIGKHLPAGRYKVTGKSNFFVRDTSGRTVVNTILGGSWGVAEYVTDLSDGMTIECRGSDTFTPVE